ncbi:MAG: M20 family metallopeptidase [Nakamurella sp.]
MTEIRSGMRESDATRIGTISTAPGGVRSQSAAALIDPDAVVEFAGALVRLRTVNEPTAAVVEQPAAELVAATMRAFGWAVTVSDIAPGRPNVIGVIDGQIVDGKGAGRTLMFEGHTDVVTEGDPAGWSFDPYAGDVVDGMLRGRGSADMKGGVAAMIHAARAVQRCGFTGRIIVGALADEEGMMLGAKAFARSDLARSGIDGVIVCEPEAGEVCATSKGAVRIRIEFSGVMAHGAMPQIGRNPIPALGEFLVGLSGIQRKMQSDAGTHPELGDFYLTPTVVDAGSAEQMNVIPASAVVHIDARTVPATPHPELLAQVRALCATVATEHGLTYVLDVIDDRPPVDTPRYAPVVRALMNAHRQITGVEPEFGGVPGTTDGTILTRDAGLETVVYGPGGKWVAHQVDEMCAAVDIVTAARVYAEAAERFLADAISGDMAAAVIRRSSAADAAGAARAPEEGAAQ